MHEITPKIFKATLAIMLVLVPMQSQAKTLANPISISLDNTIIGQGYISDNGSAMIPLRALSEKLKYSISWDKKEQTATITKGNKYIEYTANYHNAKTNDRYIQLSSEPEMKNNTIHIPIDIVDDTLDLQIGYADRTAYLSTSTEPIKLPTVNKQVPIQEIQTLLIGNNYEGFGIGGVSYSRHAMGKDGKPYQISFSQVDLEIQLVTVSLHENNPENLAFAKLILGSLVPTKANEIYNMIVTQDVIPLTLMESDGYQVGVFAKDDSGDLSLIFDGSKDRSYMKIVIENER